MPEIVSPIDGKVAYEFGQVDERTAVAAIERARHAQRGWRDRPIEHRIEVCRRVLAAYGAHLDHHAEQITRMMGKPLAHAVGEFRGSMHERVSFLCEAAPRALTDLEPAPRPGFRRFVRHEPVGVVLVIAAWNYPLLVPTNAVFPAVLAGNAVLLKHSPQTALVGDQFESAFREAGAPAGLVQALHADHGTIASLLEARRFDHVAFTGSVRGGHEVYRAAAREGFVGVGLELGGKDAAVVFPDCDFDDTVANVVDGAFFNAGQSCCAVERVYVHEDLMARFTEAVVEKTHEYVLGNPLDPATNLGPLVHARAANHVRAQMEEAVARGARQVTDDRRFSIPDLSPCYLPPRVFDRVDHGMALMRDETFGPALGIMPFASDQEAVERVNDSRYGLTASLWTRDRERALNLGATLTVGTVFQNRCDYVDPGLCWTGVKDSGHGAALSERAFDAFTRPKSYHLRDR